MRRKRKYTKEHEADIKYGSVIAGRFINYLMKDGEKAVAEKVFYKTLDKIQKESKQDPIIVFEKALENTSPLIEVASRRIGGANYQVPQEVRPERKFFLGCHWIIDAARAQKGKPMFEKLADEIVLASKNEGSAVKKKQNVHRMAEANRAFAHFTR